MDRTEYIEKAAEHFKELLAQQLDRQERMEQAAPAKDFSKMDKIVIGVVGGDGIGPIIMAQARHMRKLCPPHLNFTAVLCESSVSAIIALILK